MFWDLFVRCLWFSSLQSFLSTLLVLGIASVIAWWSLNSPKASRVKLLESLGTWLFALPSLFVAFWYMAISRKFSFLPAAGLWALVIANLLGSLLFTSFQLAHHCRSYLREKADHYGASLSLWGASETSLWRYLVIHPLLLGAKKMFPVLFVNFFSSFSLVLMLAESPSYSSLEVLLFTSLLNDFDFQKALILILVQTAMNSAFIFWISSSGVHSKNESPKYATEDSVTGLEFLNANVRRKIARFGFGGFVVFAFFLVWGLVPNLWDLLKGPPEGFREALWVSTKLLSSTLFVFVLQVWIFLRLQTSTLKKLSLLMALSPVLWAAIGYLLRLDVLVEGSAMLSFAVSAVLLNAMVAGYFALDLQHQKSQIPAHEWQLMKLWGASKKNLFWYLEWAHVRKSVFSSFLLLSLWTFSDVAISGIYLVDQNTLANHARTLAARYDFRGFSWILLFSLLFSTFVFLARSRYEKSVRVRI